MAGLDAVPVTLDQLRQPLHRAQIALDLGAQRRRVSAGVGVGCQAALRLLEPALEQLLALVQAGVAHLEVLAAPGEQRSLGVEPGPSFTTRLGGRSFGQLIGLQRRHQRLQLVDAGALAQRSVGNLGHAAPRRLQLCAHVTTFGLRSGEGIGGGAERRVVRVETAGQLGLLLTRRVQLRLRAAERSGHLSERSVGVGLTNQRLVERRRSGPAASRADAPASGPETVTLVGDQHRRGIGQRGVDGSLGGADAHGTLQQQIEQRTHVGVMAAHARPHGIRRLGDRRSAGPRPEGQHCAMHVGPMQ
jgi:hypothetical protein